MGYSAKTAVGRAKMRKAGKPVGPPKADKKKKDEAEPQYLDMSTKDEDEGGMPAVTKKGPL